MAKPQLVFFCGFCMAPQVYEGLLSRLRAKYEIRVVEFRDVTPHKPLDNVEPFLEHAIEQTADLKKFVLVGQSFGGLMAPVYAHQFPDKVSKLVLINPVIKPQKLSWLFNPLHSGDPENFLTKYGRRLSRSMSKNWLSHPIRTWRWLRLMGCVDLYPIYPQLKMPVVFIYSDGDKYFPVREQHKTAQLFPDVTEHCEKGFGHSWAITHPEKFPVELI